MVMHWTSRLCNVRWSTVPFLVCVLVLGFGSTVAQEEPATAPEEDPLGVEWVEGPASGALGPIATVNVPEGFIFAGPDDTRKLMEAMQNPINNMEMGLIAPVDSDWFVVFEFNDIGYVEDDEKASLDADAVLDSLREGQKEGNKARAERGWETLELLGWMQAPRYDPVTNNLEWGTRLRSSGATRTSTTIRDCSAGPG